MIFLWFFWDTRAKKKRKIETQRALYFHMFAWPSRSAQILSRDSVTVAVDAVVYYRVQNPTIAVSNVENFR